LAAINGDHFDSALGQATRQMNGEWVQPIELRNPPCSAHMIATPLDFLSFLWVY